ncbi:hypothetical protein B1C78_00480 [Thioalkalivibrio denitrificans]|uniref:HEAT repeat domain-containing protein n=1 Tax=Thioalkalivibrio denitrificans TaxID=108003 RepID=A0A1V3NUP9_9GAMM|nr:hypothetical protein [Thioalkalivibrio denitrificans]OOG28845.1 hypothetical protein B1C78_00480 [Thioalkalivibrio denitrificans]
MSTRPGFCPACFAPLDQSAERCPVCGARMADLSARDYGEKLLHALEHPLADVRLRAILALGRCSVAGAADALVACALCHPVDVVEGLEVVRSLRGPGPDGARRRALARLVREHPAHAVREAARRAAEAP